MTITIGVARRLENHPILPDGLTYAWLEGVMEARLTHLDDVADWEDLGRWPSGRIFGESGEYRWSRASDGKIHGVLIIDGGDLPDSFQSRALSLEKSGDSDLILWGEWVNPENDPDGNPENGPWFYASEIPERQNYPFNLSFEDLKNAAIGDKNGENIKTPRLTVRRYRHVPTEDEQFEGEFVRCVGFRLKTDEENNDHEADQSI